MARARLDLKEDSPEQIERCLNCIKPKCNNCAKNVTKTKRKGRPVVRFGNGEEVRYSSIADAARELIIAAQSIQQALRTGGRCQGYYWRYDDGNQQ